MTRDEAITACAKLSEGQEISITTVSGRTFRGVFLGKSSPETFCYFDTLDHGELKAEWGKVESLGFTSARAGAGGIMVPPEHPLAGPRASGPRPYTLRNPR